MPDAAIATPHPEVLGEAVPLYDGPIALTWDGQTFKGDGSVAYEWMPVSRVELKVTLNNVPHDVPDLPSEFEFELLANGAKGKGLWSSQHTGIGVNDQTRSVVARVASRVVSGNPAATETIVFHLPNFPDYRGTPIERGGAFHAARLTAVANGLTIEIDEVAELSKNSHALASLGLAVTHVGRIRRDDGAAIAYDAADRILEALYWWLSFVRSERTGPVLVSGVHEGETIWEWWESPTVSRWKGRASWLPRFGADAAGNPEPIDVSEVLAALLHEFEDAQKARALKRAIDWYTQSVSNEFASAKVVLAQAGLELMSWLSLVSGQGLTPEGFGRLTAADQLRLALSHAQISHAVPPGLPLFELACDEGNGNKLLDGPGGVTELRNATVHPKPNDRFDEVESVQGALLGIRYLELLLLQRLGYSGLTLNRLTWETERVPWAE